MSNTTVKILLFLSIAYTASALECYACRDCQPDFWEDRTGIVTEICPRDPQDRNDKLLRCSKHVEKDGKINRGCSTLQQCTLQELISKCSDDTLAANVIQTSCEICCEGHRCNSATMVTTSHAHILLFLLIHALLFV